MSRSGSRAGSLVTSQRGHGRSTDWSWARDAGGGLDRALPPRAALPRPHGARDRLAARGDGGLARAADPRSARPSTTSPTARTGSLDWIVVALRRREPASGSSAPTRQTYFTGWTGERMLADLRNHLFRHLQRLSLGFYERNRAGVLISRLTNDVEALDQLVTDGFTSLIQNTLDARRRGGDPLPPRLAARARDDARSSRRSASRRRSSARSRAAPTAACARRSAPSPPPSPRTSPACASCRRSPASGPRARTSAQVGEAYRVRNHETVVQNALYFPFVDLLSSLATAIILGYGGYLVFDGQTTIGILTAFLGYVDELLRPGAAALAALQHVPVGGGGARQDHGGARPRSRR